MSTHEARKFVDEVRGLEKNWMLDLGHPLLNRVADSFAKAAGVRSHASPLSASIPLCASSTMYRIMRDLLKTSTMCHLVDLLQWYTDRRDPGRHTGLLLYGRRRY